MNYPKLTISLVALAVAIPAARLVVQSNDTDAALAGTDEAGFILGVSEGGGTAEIGKRVDVITHGIAPVEYGGDVAIGDQLTSDAEGRAIKAAPGAGVTVATIGHATTEGELGVIGSVRLQPGIVTG